MKLAVRILLAVCLILSLIARAQCASRFAQAVGVLDAEECSAENGPCSGATELTCCAGLTCQESLLCCDIPGICVAEA